MAGPVVIGLNGPAGAGKSFCAEILTRRFGFKRVKFADPLKNMVRELLRTMGATSLEIERYIEGDLKEEPTHYFSGSSPRDVMQGLGEWGRSLDPDFWVTPAIVRVQGHKRSGHSVVIDDCRYENEASALLRVGASVAVVEGRRSLNVYSDHLSEKPLPPYLVTDVLDNRGNTADTYRQLRRVVRAVSEGG